MSAFNTQSGLQFEGANTDDSSQTVPGWMLTIVPFANPELSNPIPSEYNTAFQRPATQTPLRPPKWSSQINSNAAINTAPILTVTSDCISVKTNDTKENPHGTMSATVLPGNINYLAAVAPGDYIAVNMVKDYSQIGQLEFRALNGTPINLIEDGFKGIFRVTSVRLELMSDTANGIKFMAYRIEGRSFSELENSMYFNPYVASSFKPGDISFYTTAVLGKSWQGAVGAATNLQNIVESLINLILGSGPVLKTASITPVASPTAGGTNIQPKSTVRTTPNTYFQVSGAVSNLLGVPGVDTFMSLYRYFFGVQNYTTASKSIGNYSRTKQRQNVNLVGDTSTNFNPQAYSPQFTPNSTNFYFTPQPVQGMTTIRPEYFNQSTGWSIINSYCNAPVNEMYTCFRLSPEGYVMPFLIFRQIPFSSNFYVSTNAVATAFLSLPCWVIDPSIVRSLSVGRDDSLRFNFVQVFGQPFGFNSAATEASVAIQNSSNTNYVAENEDIERSGLRPYVFQNSMDFAANRVFQSKIWAQLLGDALIGGHMKLSGSISCMGIQSPITIGDNLQFDGIVYHIEGISHECSIDSAGKQNFFTNITLSHGVDASSTTTYTVYGETINKLYPAEAASEYQKQDIYPGIVNDQNNSQKTDPSITLAGSLTASVNFGGTTV